MLLQISSGGIFLGCILTGTSFFLKVHIINHVFTLKSIIIFNHSAKSKLLCYGFRDKACYLNGCLS